MIIKADNSKKEGFTQFKEDCKDIKAPLINNKELNFKIEKEFRSFMSVILILIQKRKKIKMLMKWKLSKKKKVLMT